MARQRSRETQHQQLQQEEKIVSAAGITEVSFDEIQDLLAGAKQRGEYDRQLRIFMEGDAPGWKIPLDAGPFQGKKANSVKTGFTTALGRDGAPTGAKNVRVVVKGEAVYLVKMDH